MSQAIETDIKLLTVTGDEEDVQPYSGGARVFVRLSKAPSDNWKDCFEEALKASITSTNQSMSLARVKLEVRSVGTGVCFIVTGANAEEVHAALRTLVDDTTNNIAKTKNERQAQLESQQRTVQQASQDAAASIRERLRGK